MMLDASATTISLFAVLLCSAVSIYASVIADHLDHFSVSLTVIMFVTIRVVCPTCIGFYDSVSQLATQASSLTDHILRKRVCIFGVANKIY
ncbi:hypothetical protein Plhal304r1_c011g0044101 [Plasmopara halstedii]